MKTVDHFAFQVSDLDASIEFYVRVLGLDLIFREKDDEHHEAYAFLELEGCNLELLQLLDENNEPVAPIRNELRPPYCPHLALGTDNLEGVMAQLERKKVVVLKGPLEIDGRVRWLYLTDPDGNVIEYVQWL